MTNHPTYPAAPSPTKGNQPPTSAAANGNTGPAPSPTHPPTTPPAPQPTRRSQAPSGPAVTQQLPAVSQPVRVVKLPMWMQIFSILGAFAFAVLFIQMLPGAAIMQSLGNLSTSIVFWLLVVIAILVAILARLIKNNKSNPS